MWQSRQIVRMWRLDGFRIVEALGLPDVSSWDVLGRTLISVLVCITPSLPASWVKGLPFRSRQNS